MDSGLKIEAVSAEKLAGIFKDLNLDLGDKTPKSMGELDALIASLKADNERQAAELKAEQEQTNREIAELREKLGLSAVEPAEVISIEPKVVSAFGSGLQENSNKQNPNQERQKNNAIAQEVIKETNKEIIAEGGSANEVITMNEIVKNPNETKASFGRFIKKYLKIGVIAGALSFGTPVFMGAEGSNKDQESTPSYLPVDNQRDVKPTAPVSAAETQQQIDVEHSPFFEDTFFNTLSSNAQRVYKFNARAALEGNNSSYIIADKDSACMYLLDKNNKLIAKFPAIFGAAKGEALNTANPDDSVPGKGATTPAGTYYMGKDSLDAATIKEFHGRVFDIYGSGDLSFHEPWSEEYKKRMAALNTPTVADNRISWGCINISRENYEKFVAPYFAEKSRMYILPDNGNEVAFDPAF